MTTELQTLKGITTDLAEIAKDPQGFLNTPHLPEDAGEYAEGLSKILARIPKGWGRWISCDKGWYPLIVRLDEALTAIDPDYELHQVKEKFGGLRYYFDASDHASDYAQMQKLVDAAEDESFHTCELTGEPGILMATKGGWYKTLDPLTAPEKYQPVETDNHHINEWWVNHLKDNPEKLLQHLKDHSHSNIETIDHLHLIIKRLFTALREEREKTTPDENLPRYPFTEAVPE